MEDYKRKYSEVSERLMERNRQYQKLQGLYDSLRLRNMVVSAGERDTLLQPGQLNFRSGKTSTLITNSSFWFMYILLKTQVFGYFWYWENELRCHSGCFEENPVYKVTRVYTFINIFMGGMLSFY